MKKLISLSLLALVVVAGASAQTKATESKVKAKPIHCAVMATDEIKVADATKSKLFADYKGKRYYFCCPNCAGSFKKDPAKYAAKADSTPIPAVKKTKKS